MNTPSTLVSLRITDEEVALLDSRVGLDGAEIEAMLSVQQYVLSYKTNHFYQTWTRLQSLSADL